MANFTKSQKIRISLTVIWAVITALFSGLLSEGNLGTFLGIFVFLNLPTSLSWLGLFFGGVGFFSTLISWPFIKRFGKKKDSQEGSVSVGRKILAGFIATIVFILVASLINVAEEVPKYIFLSFSERVLANVEALAAILVFIFAVLAAGKAYRFVARSKNSINEDQQDASKIEVSKSHKIAGYIITTLAIFLALSMIFISANEQGKSVAYLFGEVVGASVLLGLLTILFTPNKWIKSYQTPVWSVVFLIASIFIGYPQYQQAKIDKEAILAMAKTVEKDTVDYLASDQNQEIKVTKIEVPSSSGIAPLMEVVNSGRQNTAKIFSDYTNSFPAGFDNVLTQKTFEDLQKIEEAKLIVLEIKLQIPQYKRKIQEHFEKLESDMRIVDAEPYVKEGALKGFLENKDANKKIINDFFIIQESLLNDYLSLLTLMGNAFGSYEYDETGQVLFTYDEHIDAYNSLIESIQENALKEEEWNAMVAQKELEKVNKIKNSYAE